MSHDRTLMSHDVPNDHIFWIRIIVGRFIHRVGRCVILPDDLSDKCITDGDGAQRNQEHVESIPCDVQLPLPFSGIPITPASVHPYAIVPGSSFDL
jgi:hypothetical protein